MKYSWPGNVRELQNTIESLVVMNLKDVIDQSDLPSHIVGQNRHVDLLAQGLSLRELEEAAIRRALKRHDGRRKESAADLGISVRTLQRKIKLYDLESSSTDPSTTPLPAGFGSKATAATSR